MNSGCVILVWVVLIFALIPLMVMGLWNWFMPELFGVAYINYWHALGMIVLGRLICGFNINFNNKQ